MAAKKKPETGNSKLETLLKDAGFSKVRKINERIIHASSAEDFGKSHAAFLQAAGNHVAYIDSRRFSTVPQPILIVHRKPVGEEVSETSTTGNQKPATDQEQAD